MATKVSYWLIPSQEDRAFFQDMIDTLAREYDAPSFTPHVTIYSGDSAPNESPDELIEQAIQGVRPFSLKCDRILYSPEFTKTLFVQFQPNSILSQISHSLQSNSKHPSDYTLNPHLSLIYQQMSEETKKKLATSLTLPKSEVIFDEVMAISSPERTQTREDVESWQVICIRKL
ncbi:MAG TPA: 2'-5' RNA ligase family protein [Allocoleopsis sp.]